MSTSAPLWPELLRIRAENTNYRRSSTGASTSLAVLECAPPPRGPEVLSHSHLASSLVLSSLSLSLTLSLSLSLSLSLRPLSCSLSHTTPCEVDGVSCLDADP